MAQRSKLHTKGLNTMGVGGLILSTGLMGFLLTSSVVTSGFFGAVNHLRPARLLSFAVLGAIGFAGLVFLSGLTLSFVSGQSANDLWNRLCAENNLTKRDLYVLVVSCGSLGPIFDKAILTSGVVPAMFKLSYLEFFSPKVLPQVLVTVMACRRRASSRSGSSVENSFDVACSSGKGSKIAQFSSVCPYRER
jgi:hypothetical protein